MKSSKRKCCKSEKTQNHVNSCRFWKPEILVASETFIEGKEGVHRDYSPSFWEALNPKTRRRGDFLRNKE